jgi:hypothetical protein
MPPDNQNGTTGPRSIRQIEGLAGSQTIDRLSLLNNINDPRHEGFILGSNNAAFVTFANETFINANGNKQRVGDFFYEILTTRDMTDADTYNYVLRTLEPVYFENKLVSGADWFGKFVDEYLDNEEARNVFDNSDGESQANSIASVLAVLKDRVAKLGMSMDEDTLRQVATVAVKSKWNDTQIMDRLLEGFNFGELQTGDMTAFADTTRQLGTNYLVTLTDQRIADLTQRAFAGELSEEAILQMIQQQAIAEMPFLESYIDRGLRPIDAFGSLVGTAARELELDENEIDLMDSKWRDMMVRQNDDGTQRLATMGEVRQAVRDLPEWQNTEAAQNNAQQVGVAIASIFGRGGF